MFDLKKDPCWYCFDESRVKQNQCPVCKGEGFVLSLTKAANFTKPLFGAGSTIVVDDVRVMVMQLSFMYTAYNMDEPDLSFWAYDGIDEKLITVSKEEIRSKGFMLLEDYWRVEAAYVDLLPDKNADINEFLYHSY